MMDKDTEFARSQLPLTRKAAEQLVEDFIRMYRSGFTREELVNLAQNTLIAENCRFCSALLKE